MASYFKTYIKQSETANTGHIYEHVILNHTAKELKRAGYQMLIDYEWLASCEDGIIIVRFETHSRAVFRLFEKLINYSDVDAKMIDLAVEQVQCEYERLENIDRKKLRHVIRELTHTPWTTFEDLTFTKPITEESRQFITAIGGFGRRSPKSFEEHFIAYRITDCPYELKTLAVYVMLIIAVNMIEILYSKLGYVYDSGDEWAEYQELVGYAHKVMSLKTRNVTEESLQRVLDTTIEELSTKKSIKKITRYVKQDTAKDFSFFNSEDFFAKAYQLAGVAGMNQVTTPENIRIIFDKIEIKIEKVER